LNIYSYPDYNKKSPCVGLKKGVSINLKKGLTVYIHVCPQVNTLFLAYKLGFRIIFFDTKCNSNCNSKIIF